MGKHAWLSLLAGLLAAAWPARGAEILLPQERSAYYSDEPIELAVAGLDRGTAAALELVPAGNGLFPVKLAVKGDGSTVALTLPPGSLAPDTYTLRLDGQAAGKLTVSTGVNESTLLLSQTVNDPKAAGGNFLVGNAFSFGLLDPQGRPLRDPRGRRSQGMEAFEKSVRADLPALVYVYWTGYVLHKPFGSEKSWPNPQMIEATRLLNFHTAQRLRRYARTVHAVGTLDEPGLSWGRTPAGGMASGFPNWDEEAWYRARGWAYTDNPASRPDDDWMKYLTARCAIIKEVNAQAKKDLKTVWPGVVFSTDLYAPQAIMDGTDPLNQQVNDVPSSHVFLDWGVGKLGALSGVYLEKAHAPASKLAHAMNGQLFGATVPQPAQSNAYHLMRNALLAAGLHSNWWLNPTGMGPADLAAVNEPGLRLGPLFVEMAPRGHDVAVLWSFTEIGMREKDITAREARKKTGEQIKLLIPTLVETTGQKDGMMEVNAYNVGGNYKDQVLGVHQALTRAGYPAHILHERLLPQGALKDYRTLVVVGQTFALPAGVRKAIADFVEGGGQVVVDPTTTVKLPGSVPMKADWRDPGFYWGSYFTRVDRKDPAFKSARDASYYWTNFFMDSKVRGSVPAVREALRGTKSRPVLVTDSVHLAAEKHVGGEGAIYLVLNAFEKLPEIPPEKSYFLYNHAPYSANFTLKGIAPGSVVYCFEGTDWKKVRKIEDPQAAQAGEFAPGEMKVYLVAPRQPGGLDVEAEVQRGMLAVRAGLRGVKTAWPLAVTVRGPGGREMYHVWRATDAAGSYRESFPIGANAAAGMYTVQVGSPAGPLEGEAKAEHRPAEVAAVVREEGVRVFDREAMTGFLAGKPEVVIVLGNEGQKGAAQKLAAGLKEHGIPASVQPEAEVLRKARYPRVWNPYADVFVAAGEEKKAPGPIKAEIKLGVAADGTVTALAADGKEVAGDWRRPQSRVTFVGDGWVMYDRDREQCFEPGVKMYIDDKGQMTVLRGEHKEERTTAAFRARWSRPWQHLSSHVGAFQLPPELPEAYRADSHLILLGDSSSGTAVAALQASEILPQVADARYPGKGKALVSFAWSPFAVEKNVILVGAADAGGLNAGIARVIELAGGKK
jgi:hypothetical protein